MHTYTSPHRQPSLLLNAHTLTHSHTHFTSSQAPTPTPAPPPRAAPAAKAKRPTGGVSNVRSLADMNKDSDDEDERPEEWYTGGAKSGQVVQDPKKPKSNEVGPDIVYCSSHRMTCHVIGCRSDS